MKQPWFRVNYHDWELRQGDFYARYARRHEPFEVAFYRIHYEPGEHIGRYVECFPVEELPALARLVERTLQATLKLRSEQSD